MSRFGSAIVAIVLVSALSSAAEARGLFRTTVKAFPKSRLHACSREADDWTNKVQERDWALQLSRMLAVSLPTARLSY